MLLVGVMAEELGGMMRLRVEDKDIDAAELLRVTVSESTTGRGRKRNTSFVCKGTYFAQSQKQPHGGRYARAQKKVNTDSRCEGAILLAAPRA